MLTFYLSMLDNETDKLNFEQIYINYEKDIYRRVYKILRSKEDTEDAVQETWKSVCEHISLLNGMSAERKRAYIFGIAKNPALSIIRKRKKEALVMCDIGDIEGIIDDREVYDACGKFDIAAVRDCMEKLGEPYSDVLLYYYLHEHTIKEIAKILNTNENTVGSRLRRGRQKLIELLEGEGIV